MSWYKRLFGGSKSEPQEETIQEAEAPAVEIAVEIEPVQKIAIEAQPAPVAPPQPKLSFFARIARGLKRSSQQFTDKLTKLITHKKLDGDTLESLEDVLIESDLGVKLATELVEALRVDRFEKDTNVEDVKQFLAKTIAEKLQPFAQPMKIALSSVTPKSSFDLGHEQGEARPVLRSLGEGGSEGLPAARIAAEISDAGRIPPHVIVMVGVNGTGKTTTTGKLAHMFGKAGLKTILAAGDTFRAAAVAQLERWGERSSVEVVAMEEGQKGDAASVAFAAHERAVEIGADVLIVDTAGRLQNKEHLMEELSKLVRVLKKRDETAPHEVILVLDATTGQNAMQQAEAFSKVVGVTGLVITKLDGTARGGILVPVATTYKLPVHFIGVGENIEDLLPFEAEPYAKGLVGLE